ncbi:MAG: PilZ domain-containing protein, partial [Planctomycetota bacterium]
MSTTDKRRHKRSQLNLDLSCRRIDADPQEAHVGRTLNVSTGGLYFETSAPALKPGNLIRIDLAIPPSPGLLQFGGKLRSLAKVLRTETLARQGDLRTVKHRIAVQFCRGPKLST